MDNVSLVAAWVKVQSMLQGTIRLLPNLILGLVIFVVSWFAAQFLRQIVTHLITRQEKGKNLGVVVGRLTQWVAIIVGILLALTIVLPDFNPSDFVASLGIGGVAIGFAFRDVLQNFLAGLLILLTEPFQINDQVVFKDYEGTVDTIETRATTIRTYDGRRVVIPNAELFTHAVTVNTAYEQRRLQYEFGIGYGTNITEAKDIIMTVLSEQEDILRDPVPEVFVVALADFTINLCTRWWIAPPRQSDLIEASDRVLQAVYERLLERGIDMPFPTRQILLCQQASKGE